MTWNLRSNSRGDHGLGVQLLVGSPARHQGCSHLRTALPTRGAILLECISALDSYAVRELRAATVHALSHWEVLKGDRQTSHKSQVQMQRVYDPSLEGKASLSNVVFGEWTEISACPGNHVFPRMSFIRGVL